METTKRGEIAVTCHIKMGKRKTNDSKKIGIVDSTNKKKKKEKIQWSIIVVDFCSTMSESVNGRVN